MGTLDKLYRLLKTFLLRHPFASISLLYVLFSLAVFNCFEFYNVPTYACPFVVPIDYRVMKLGLAMLGLYVFIFAMYLTFTPSYVATLPARMVARRLRTILVSSLTVSILQVSIYTVAAWPLLTSWDYPPRSVLIKYIENLRFLPLMYEIVATIVVPSIVLYTSWKILHPESRVSTTRFVLYVLLSFVTILVIGVFGTLLINLAIAGLNHRVTATLIYLRSYDPEALRCLEHVLVTGEGMWIPIPTWGELISTITIAYLLTKIVRRFVQS